MSCLRARMGVGVSVWVAMLCCGVGMATDVNAEEGEDLYFGANALYNRKLYDLAVNEYEAFLKAFRHGEMEVPNVVV